MPFDRGRSPAFPLDDWAAATAAPALTPLDRDTARERVSCFRRRFDESGCTKRFSSPRKLRRLRPWNGARGFRNHP
jgi:hypothetical protein